MKLSPSFRRKNVTPECLNLANGNVIEGNVTTGNAKPKPGRNDDLDQRFPPHCLRDTASTAHAAYCRTLTATRLLNRLPCYD